MDSILNHFHELKCTEFYDVCVKYFLIPIENLNNSSKQAKTGSNPAEFLVNDILQIVASNKHEISLNAPLSSQTEQLKSILLKEMKTENDFFPIFNRSYDIDEFPIFKTAILAQTAINNQLTIESKKARQQQQLRPQNQSIPISLRKSQPNLSSSDSLTKFLTTTKVNIFIFKAFISLTLLLHNYKETILNDGEIKTLPKSNFAAFFYLLKYFDVFITNDDIQQYMSNNSSESNKKGNLLGNDKIDINDFFTVLTQFLSFFTENSIDFITFKDKNSLYFNFFMSILTTTIQMMPKFSLLNRTDFFLFPITFYFSYFSSKNIVYQQYDMIIQIYSEMCNQLKSILNENSPQLIQTKVLFLLSSVINNFDVSNNMMPIEQSLKICFDSLSIFPKLPIILTDKQSTLIFTTSVLGFINSISTKYQTEADFENYQKTNPETKTKSIYHDLHEADEAEKLQYMNPQDYFSSHALMHFFSIQEAHPNPIVQNFVKSMKNFFNQSNFDTNFVFQALTSSISALKLSSYSILLSSFTGKFIKICDPVVDFISHLLQLEIYKIEPKMWNYSQIQLNDSILFFIFGIISKNKVALPVFTAISRLNFLILKYLLPMFRSLAMIDEEIKFTKQFCQSHIIDMIRFNLTQAVMSNEKSRQMMNEIVIFLQVIAVSNPRAAFNELSFVQLLKDLLKIEDYVDFLLPCFKTGILTTDDKCVVNILQQITLIVVQAMEDENYVTIANKCILILSETMNSIAKKNLKEYEDNHIFELISKFPSASKNRESLVISLKFFLNACLKFNSYIQMFSDILIYQNLEESFNYVNFDSEIFQLLLSMTMNSVIDLDKIEKYTIQNRCALKLLVTVIKNSNEELDLLKCFQKICSSNNSNIYECYQSGLVFYLLERVDVPELQNDVFSLFQLICTKVCSPMILNKVHNTMFSSKCKILLLNTLLKMIKDDSSLQVSSFFDFSGPRTGIFGPSIDLSYLTTEWSFSTAINIEKVPSMILSLSEGSSNLTFSINQDFKLEFIRTEKKLNFDGEFKKPIECKKWTFLTFIITETDISLFINFENKETFQLSDKFTYNGPAMIKIAEGFTGEIGRTYFFSTTDINIIKNEVLSNDIIKKHSICSYDPRGAYMGEIIDAASDNRCHLMGTAVPFSSSFKDVIQSERIFQLFMTYFSIVDSEEFFILCLQILTELINISEENGKYFEKIGGFRLLIGLFSMIDKKYFTLKISEQIFLLFSSLKDELLQKKMFVSYWINLTFINSLDYEYQIHFYKVEFYNALYVYKYKVTSEFASSLLFEITKSFDDNINDDIKNIRELQLSLLLKIINDYSSSIYKNLFQFQHMLYNKNIEIEIQKQILNTLVNYASSSISQNQFDMINYASPLFLSKDNEIKLLGFKFISNLISNLQAQQITKENIYNVLMFIKDDEANLFNECFKRMFLSNQQENLNLLDESIQIDSIVNEMIPSCECIEMTPILIMLSIFHTKQNDSVRNKVFNLMYHAFPKLGLFYHDLASPLFLLLFSLNFSDDLDRFVEPFVVASFSNIQLINYILPVFNSFSKFSKTDVFKWKLHFLTKLIQKSIKSSLYIKEIVTLASQFLIHRFKSTIKKEENENEEIENENKKDEEIEIENKNDEIEKDENVIYEIFDDVTTKTFSEKDSLDFIEYLANSTSSSTLDQAYVFEPCFIENEEYLELLLELLYLIVSDKKYGENYEIELSSSMKYNAQKLRKIIASIILKNDPSNEIKCQIFDINTATNNPSSPQSAPPKKQSLHPLFKSLFNFKNHNNNNNNNNEEGNENTENITSENELSIDDYSLTASEENFITSFIKEGESLQYTLINDLKYDWQYLLDLKPIFFSFRTEILAKLFKNYIKYIEQNQKENENQTKNENEIEKVDYLEFYSLEILNSYKLFRKTIKRRIFMYQKYNQKLATTYLNESNEKGVDSTKKHWKVSSKIDSSGRKLYFSINRNFNNHIDASNLRDSLTGEFNENEKEGSKNKDEQIITYKRILEINRSLTKYKKAYDLSFDVMMNTVIGKYQGKLVVTKTMLLFEGTLKYETFNDDNNKKNKKHNEKQKFISIPFEQILFIFNRLTMHIDNSCEVYSLMRKSFFFIFSDNQTRKKFYDKIGEIIGKKYKNFRTSYFFTECCHICNGVCQNNISNSDLVLKTNLIKDWQTRKITNFQYLFFLNIISGRSFNDLSQYPVYPWIIKDYESEKIDLNDEKIYRDLSLPISAMNEIRLNECIEHCNEMNDPLEKCLFRSHYSSAAVIIGFMIRLEPFTSLHIDLQSGRFDCADRLFYSIEKTWNSITSTNNDYKELIPEFFTFPQIFLNENKFDLGKIQGHDYQINDVLLPKWASNAYEFVEINQRALESEYVRLHLNEWIDLIFGCYQKSFEKRTLYHPFCYHDCMKLADVINDPANQQLAQYHAANFGSCPDKLFITCSPKSTFSMPRSMTVIPQQLSINMTPMSMSTNAISLASVAASASSSVSNSATSLNLSEKVQQTQPVQSNPPLSSFNLEAAQNQLMNNQALLNAFSDPESVTFYGNGIVLLKNGSIFSVLKNFLQVSRISMQIQPNYKKVLFFKEHHSFVFLQRNGGFASCVTVQTQQQQEVLKTIYHKSSTIECLCPLGKNILVTGGSDCCINVWKVPDFSLMSSIPIQSGIIVAIGANSILESIIAIDIQNMAYLISINPVKHILTFPLNLPENVTKHNVLLLRNGMIVVASDSADRKNFSVSFFDLRGFLIKKLEFDGSVAMFFAMEPSCSENLVGILVAQTKKLIVIDLATFEIPIQFKENAFNGFIWPFEDRRAILYLKNALKKEISVFEF